MEQRIYYKSDFSFVLVVSDENGADIGWPDFDWTARFFTQTPAISFTASCIGGVCVNCYNDNGHIRIVAKDHHLSAGTLRVDFTGKMEDGRFPNCIRKEVSAAILDGVPLTADREVGKVVLHGATGDGQGSTSGSGGVILILTGAYVEALCLSSHVLESCIKTKAL